MTVDVWRCHLDVDDASLVRYGRMLREDEHWQAAQVRDPSKRRRAVATKGILRAVLASYVDVRPGSLIFSLGSQGKPRLEGHGRVRFSVSRSGSLALVAVAAGREVGVDVERIDPRRALGPIADALFDESETEELRMLSDDDRVGRFFELWTRKEALAKACGAGLTSAAFRRAVPARYGRWSIHDLPAEPDYAGAVCFEGRARVCLIEYGT